MGRFFDRERYFLQNHVMAFISQTKPRFGRHHAEIKEKASDRWENLISGPNPAAEFVWAGAVFFGAPLDLGGVP